MVHPHQPHGSGQQNPGQHPGGQYYPGRQGGPSQRRRTGAIVVVVASVVGLLAGLGVAGFVEPGFFLSDGKAPFVGSAADPTTTPNGNLRPQTVILNLVEAANDKDADVMSDLACADVGSHVQSAIADVDETDGAELADSEVVSAEKARATVHITVTGSTRAFEVVVVKRGGAWCWHDISARDGQDGPTGASDLPTPHDGAEGQALIRTFLDKTNAGDAAAAQRLLCADSDSQVELASAIQGKANLEINTAGQVLSKPDFAAADLKGTVNGEPVSVGRVSAFYQDGGWCVFTFYTA